MKRCRSGVRPSRGDAHAAWRTFLFAVVALAGWAAAQPRAELTLGVAGAPVAGAWTPLRAVVRDAPGATLRLDLDAGGLERGEVLQTVRARVAAAGGVQRLDLNLPLPSWRRLTWRIEQDGRVLASGGLGARARDGRPLHLILSSRPARWRPSFVGDARVVGAATSDLPGDAAGWDGVATLLIDGSTVAPEARTVVTAAASGVRVLLPEAGPAGYGPLAELLVDGPRRVGAGTLEPVPATAGLPLPEPPLADWPRTVRDGAVAAAASVLEAPTWRHVPKPWVLVSAAGYALLVWTLLQVGGAPGVASAVLVVVAAALAVPFATPPDSAPVSRGEVVLAGDGLGVRVPLRAVARLPEGASELAGAFRPTEPRQLRWGSGATVVPLPAGGRARLVGAPEIVAVPGDVRAVGAGEGDPLPASLREVLPADVVGVRRGDAWWLVRRPAGPMTAAPPVGLGRRVR
jgi:hypothetical protein